MKLQTLSTFIMVLASKFEEEKYDADQGSGMLPKINGSDNKLKPSFQENLREINNYSMKYLGLDSNYLDPLSMFEFDAFVISLIRLDEDIYKPIKDKTLMKWKGRIHLTKQSLYTAMLESSEGILDKLYEKLTQIETDNPLIESCGKELHTKLKFLLDILQSFSEISPVIDGKPYLETSTDVLMFLLSDLIEKVNERIANLRDSDLDQFKQDSILQQTLIYYFDLMSSIDEDIFNEPKKLQQNYFQAFISNLADVIIIINGKNHPNWRAIEDLMIIFKNYSDFFDLVTFEYQCSGDLGLLLKNLTPKVDNMARFILKYLLFARNSNSVS